MGRHIGKKLERKEKSKVKLRAKNAGIAKAKNVTDTSFKAHKILIQEQLKRKDLGIPYSKRKLSVKDLLSRLHHHNFSVRQDALLDLKELVTGRQNQEVLRSYLGKIIEGIAKLILDQEREVRKSAARLLEDILEQVDTKKLSPFFKMLLSYLGCGMTHIHPNIQEDALLVLDVLLKVAPKLLAENARQILPNFLNMISRLKTESRPERTLTMNLGSTQLSIKWRFKVLCHMHTLLLAMVDHYEAEICSKDIESSNTYYWNSEKAMYIPVYKSHYLKVCHLLDVSCNIGETSPYSDGEKLKNFAGVLMPLLKETWLEAMPSGNEQENALSMETALLLQCIVEIIQLLWELLLLWEKKGRLKTLSTEFASTYRKDFEKHFLRGFPYTRSHTVMSEWKEFEMKNRQQMKQKKKTNNWSVLWKGKTVDDNCTEINLTLCRLFCNLHDTEDPPVNICTNVVEYTKTYINYLKKNPQEGASKLTPLLQILLKEHSTSWEQLGVDFTSLMDVVLMYSLQLKSPDPVAEELTQILCDITTSPGLAHLHRSQFFMMWLCSLPKLLLQPTIHVSAVKAIVKLAYQSREFATSLLQAFSCAYDNMNKIKVTGVPTEHEGKMHVIGILYCLKKLDYQERGYWNDDLAVSVAEMLLPKA